MTDKSIKPIIGVTSSVVQMPGSQVHAHASGQRYLTTLVDMCDCIAVGIPALAERHDYDQLAAILDGVFLTGGRANVEPFHYDGPEFPEDEPVDPARDATAMALIPACIAAGVPMFGSCRGLQEMNVALGGSLHYRINHLPGKMDHRMPRGGNVATADVFIPRHAIRLTAGGLFHELAGTGEAMVNTLHGQGIDRLADGFIVEAMAPDGIIEGISMPGAKAFTVGIQWHAEWEPETHKLTHELYKAFSAAARERALKRQH